MRGGDGWFYTWHNKVSGGPSVRCSWKNRLTLHKLDDISIISSMTLCIVCHQPSDFCPQRDLTAASIVYYNLEGNVVTINAESISRKVYSVLDATSSTAQTSNLLSLGLSYWNLKLRLIDVNELTHLDGRFYSMVKAKQPCSNSAEKVVVDVPHRSSE